MGVKPVIDRVHLVPMGMANASLIESDDGLTLIDAGFPRKEAAVFEAIRGLGRSPDQLKHLIFTHGHSDHIGSKRSPDERSDIRDSVDLVASGCRIAHPGYFAGRSGQLPSAMEFRRKASYHFCARRAACRSFRKPS
jgi:glyoxylase-like metal-dependent hydrolase (beta-lactamase superfamily II)